MKLHHHTRAFEQVLAAYDGQLPLHRFLVNYFRQNKQMGSSDRRWASRYIYSYFRLGRALTNRPVLERLAVADFLCNDNMSLIAQSLMPDFAEQVGLSLDAKLDLVTARFPDFALADIFSFKNKRSEGVDNADFLKSFLIQPNLFIRLIAEHRNVLMQRLSENAIPFKVLSTDTVALPNGTKLEQIFDASWYQIQDYSSQRTADFFKPVAYEYWWDCCAASGGKSLLLHKLEPRVQLLVSDRRESSLGNLKERFELYGIKSYQKKVMDLTEDNTALLHHYEFDGILLDAPCSGSGTWGRTPEMLYFFDEKKVEDYIALQKKIAQRVVKYLKKGKPLIYMTCSVFAKENEDILKFLVSECGLILEDSKLIVGYQDRADNMFVARLIKL